MAAQAGRRRGRAIVRCRPALRNRRVSSRCLGADQQAGVLRVVLVQQVRRRLEHVDGLDQVGLIGREQADTAVGEPNCAQQQRIQRVCMLGDGDAGRAGRVQRRQDVLCGNAIGVAEVPQRLPVGANGLAARVQRQQNLIGVSGRLTDPFALTADAVGERRQHAVELGRVDLVEHADHVLEHRVDLDS